MDCGNDHSICLEAKQPTTMKSMIAAILFALVATTFAGYLGGYGGYGLGGYGGYGLGAYGGLGGYGFGGFPVGRAVAYSSSIRHPSYGYGAYGIGGYGLGLGYGGYGYGGYGLGLGHGLGLGKVW